jgi:hypothetical protein
MYRQWCIVNPRNNIIEIGSDPADAAATGLMRPPLASNSLSRI